MIVKLHQPVEGLHKFFRTSRSVLAKRMPEDFLVETASGSGWQQGKRGDWLVSTDDMWMILSTDQFEQIFLPDRRAKERLAEGGRG